MSDREKRRNKKERRSRKYESIRKESIPDDYCVEEDEFGRLVNRERRLVWPGKTPMKPHEFAKFLITPPSEDEEAERRSRSYKDSVSDEDSLNITSVPSSKKTSPVRNSIESIFIGGATPSQAARKIGSSSFVLYYRVSTGNEELAAPLYMAYRSSKGKVFHFPMVRQVTTCGGREVTKVWRVDYGDPSAKEFNSLSTLVEHYRIFSTYDSKSDSLEAFPIWKGKVFDYYE